MKILKRSRLRPLIAAVALLLILQLTSLSPFVKSPPPRSVWQSPASPLDRAFALEKYTRKPFTLETGSDACGSFHDLRRDRPSSKKERDVELYGPHVGIAEAMAGRDTFGMCEPASERLSPLLFAARWENVRLGQAQSRCASQHWGPHRAPRDIHKRGLQDWRAQPQDSDHPSQVPEPETTGRVAVILRTKPHQRISREQAAWIRLLTAELALDTSGQAQVFILVQLEHSIFRAGNRDLEAFYLRQVLPEDMHDMALIYSKDILRYWYRFNSDPVEQDYQPLQIFSHVFPEFDHIWQLDIDLRFTGNAGHMLKGASEWAALQPRNNLCERNKRYFIPELWRNYASFSKHINREMKSGSCRMASPKTNKTFSAFEGVHEEADLITLAPLDPWRQYSVLKGQDSGAALGELRPPPQPAFRMSRKLLRLMSYYQRETSVMMPRLSVPGAWTEALDMKAVYVPHLVSFDFSSAAATQVTATSLDEMLLSGSENSRPGDMFVAFALDNNGDGSLLNASYSRTPGSATALWSRYLDGSCEAPMVLYPVTGQC